MNGLGIFFVFQLFLLFVVPLLKLDLPCVLIGVPLFWLLVAPEKNLPLLLERFAVFILLLGKQ
ncbi:hypothetical protein SLEP1_g55141 [Rubroshorea leprosula]|uniref:Uncharacterized protein n=1 Tax=Rubroshorea leprosula TaxID=152421 RepID=A0AAV5MFQ0_9ROSI|nr:hypothetical protein SLEP1_g55141 [Rubroshorea leprosula]